MSKFKVGDIVRVAGCKPYIAAGIVTSVDEEFDEIGVLKLTAIGAQFDQVENTAYKSFRLTKLVPESANPSSPLIDSLTANVEQAEKASQA